MKKKGTIGLVATLGLGLCAYALSQQAPVKEDKKNQNQVQYLQGDKKKSASSSNKQEESIESVNSKEKTKAEQIVVKITDEGFVTSHVQPCSQACCNTATTFCWKIDGKAPKIALVIINTTINGNRTG